MTPQHVADHRDCQGGAAAVTLGRTRSLDDVVASSSLRGRAPVKTCTRWTPAGNLKCCPMQKYRFPVLGRQVYFRDGLFTCGPHLMDAGKKPSA